MITFPTEARMAADDRRARLAEAIGKLALAIVADTCEPDIVELRILAQLCDEHQLPVEAARIRRWMAAS